MSVVDEKRAHIDPDHIGLTEKHIIEDANIDVNLLHIGHGVISRQKEEGFIATWRNHWRAAMWSIFISTALWMEGYDGGVTGSYFGLPQFQKRFGVEIGHTGTYAIPAATQSAFGWIGTGGQMLGLIICGLCQERFGSKWTFIGGMIFITGAVFSTVLAPNIQVLLASSFLMGVPLGMFQTLTVAYAAEICPINMRGYLAAYSSVGWGGGRFVSTGVVRGCLGLPGDLAWRIPYAVQWIWPVPLLLAAYWAPESPWWLVRRGEFEKAKAVVRRTASPGFYQEGEVDGYVEYMKHTDALDRAEKAKGRFFDLFRGTNLRRTELQIGTWLVSLWNGNAITNLTVEFLEDAGMSITFAFDFNIIVSALAIAGVAGSWVLLRWFPRRKIYIGGVIATMIANIIIGVLGVVPATDSSLMGVGALMTIINFLFHFAVSPVAFVIVAELPASRLRAQSLVLGRFIYVCVALVVNTLNPYMVSSTAWNWKAKAGFFWAGCGALCITWAFFRMPETGGFSFAELDILFANKVSARKFRTTAVTDQLAETDGNEYTQQQITGEQANDEKAQVDHVELR